MAGRAHLRRRRLFCRGCCSGRRVFLVTGLFTSLFGKDCCWEFSGEPGKISTRSLEAAVEFQKSCKLKEYFFLNLARYSRHVDKTLEAVDAKIDLTSSSQDFGNS